MARPTEEDEALELVCQLWLPPAWRTYILTEAKSQEIKVTKLVRQLLKQSLPDHITKGDQV